MKFEWDESKSPSNKHKHGIDFNRATELWKDTERIEIETPYPIENRSILIAKIGDKHWTAIFTRRPKGIRIISVRHSRKKEVSFYEEKETGQYN